MLVMYIYIASVIVHIHSVNSIKKDHSFSLLFSMQNPKMTPLKSMYWLNMKSNSSTLSWYHTPRNCEIAIAYSWFFSDFSSAEWYNNLVSFSCLMLHCHCCFDLSSPVAWNPNCCFSDFYILHWMYLFSSISQLIDWFCCFNWFS